MDAEFSAAQSSSALSFMCTKIPQIGSAAASFMNPYLGLRSTGSRASGPVGRPECQERLQGWYSSPYQRPAVNGSGVGPISVDHRAGDNNRIDEGAVDVKPQLDPVKVSFRDGSEDWGGPGHKAPVQW